MKKFTIVARPNHNHQDKNKKQEWVHFFPQYNSKSLSTRLRSDPDSLGEAEKILKDNSGFSLEIIHPKSNNHYTVCIWESDRQPNKYYIQNPRELDTFDTTARDNLLYLPKLHYKLRQEVKQFIEFRNLRDDKHYRYQVIEAEKLGFPPSLASTKNSISEGFFKQVGENDGVNPEILELDYDEAATAITNVNMDDYQEAGWLNPVILTLALDGSDIKHIYNAKDGYLKSLNLFLEQSSIILVEPHIDDNYDLRISLLIKFHNLIQQAQENKVDSQNFSLVEYFLFGSQCVQPWKPFLALDLLEGKFYARQQVHQIQEIPIITWEPPQDMPANKHWFAKHWREKWKNMQQETSHSQINIVPPPYQARPYRPSKGLDTLPVNSLSNPLTSILSKHPQFNLKKTNLLELFEDFEKENSRKLLCDNFFPLANTETTNQSYLTALKFGVILVQIILHLNLKY